MVWQYYFCSAGFGNSSGLAGVALAVPVVCAGSLDWYVGLLVTPGVVSDAKQTLLSQAKTRDTKKVDCSQS